MTRYLRLCLFVTWLCLVVPGCVRYEPDADVGSDPLHSNKLMHLTNTAVNLKSKEGSSNTMWSLDKLKGAMGEAAFDAVWAEVKRALTHLMCNWDTRRTDRQRTQHPRDAEQMLASCALSL